MTTFEERYNAWIEDRLSGPEAAAFERELEARPAPAEERRDSAKLGALLRQHAAPPRLTNGDFFNHQLMARIAADERVAAPRPVARWDAWKWSMPHLGWAGVCALLLCFTLSRSVVAPSGPPSAIPVVATMGAALSPIAGGGAGPSAAGPLAYSAQVLDVHAADPSISATAVHFDQEDVTVLWLDGLDYLPDDYQLQ